MNQEELTDLVSKLQQKKNGKQIMVIAARATTNKYRNYFPPRVRALSEVVHELLMLVKLLLNMMLSLTPKGSIKLYPFKKIVCSAFPN